VTPEKLILKENTETNRLFYSSLNFASEYISANSTVNVVDAMAQAMVALTPR
jgi:hypothetical protein